MLLIWGANINIGRIRGQYCKGADKSADRGDGGCRVPGTGRLRGTEGRKDRIEKQSATIMQTNFINTCAEGADHGGSGKTGRIFA